ncbi:MAG: DUF3301 domain-containing protein [Paraglaciecola sp.]|nr:DUF3301 domain-containing protein [Paraglaciecola sp.]NCT49035.1 DUF3301 domain-containing protein [Paraglaciecola sp.]
MNLYDLLLFMVIAFVIFQFWRFRAITEGAYEYLRQYCDNHDLQLLSVSRVKSRIGSYRGKLDWQSEFAFEFSGNGEDSDRGFMYMAGTKVIQVDTPAYRVH